MAKHSDGGGVRRVILPEISQDDFDLAYRVAASVWENATATPELSAVSVASLAGALLFHRAAIELEVPFSAVPGLMAAYSDTARELVLLSGLEGF